MGENVNNEKHKVSFMDGLKAEFKKIIWPDRKTVFKQALVVTAISVVIGVIIAVLDMALQYGISFLTM